MFYVRDPPLAQHATHVPKHDFTPEQYLAERDASSVAFGVLTAPSFEIAKFKRIAAAAGIEAQ